jgi:hypothetical protein
VGDGVVEVLGVPAHERVESEAQRAEPVFLAVSVGLAQLALVAVQDDPGDGVAAFVAGEADACLSAVFLAVDPAEEVKCFCDPADLSDGTSEAAGVSAAL